MPNRCATTPGNCQFCRLWCGVPSSVPPMFRRLPNDRHASHHDVRPLWDCLPWRVSRWHMALRGRRSLRRSHCRHRGRISAARLGQALAERRSQRDFSSRPLPTQVLSELLWSAYGVNRPGHPGPHRAILAACARDRNLRGDGDRTWRYDPLAHRLAAASRGRYSRPDRGARFCRGGAADLGLRL